jgi:radical SAM protein with 4Fe4S-binding SPASM domain
VQNPRFSNHFLFSLSHILTKSLGLKVEIVSNGYEVKQTLLDNLVGNVDLFTVSLDGIKENHNLMRRNPQSYDDAINTIRRAANLGVTTGALMTLNKLNYRDIPEVSSLLEKMGKNIRFSVKMMIPPLANQSSDLTLSREDSKEVEYLCSHYKIQDHSFISRFGNHGNYSFFGCTGGKLDAVIDINGEVFGCLYHRKKNKGNTLKESFKDIWFRSNLQRISQKSSKCGECNNYKRCGGFCTLFK